MYKYKHIKNIKSVIYILKLLSKYIFTYYFYNILLYHEISIISSWPCTFNKTSLTSLITWYYNYLMFANIIYANGLQKNTFKRKAALNEIRRLMLATLKYKTDEASFDRVQTNYTFAYIYIYLACAPVTLIILFLSTTRVSNQ